jgi:histone-lysine N-methyltransferase SETMAR
MLVGISHGICHKILTEDLKMRRVTSKFVPRLLIVDNAPAHAALLTRTFLTDNNMTVVPHPPYSPNLAPCEFFLFPKLKMKLKGQ